MGDDNKKVVSKEIMNELIAKIQEIVNNYCYNLQYFTESEVDNFFQASSQEITYYNSLINDNVESKNFIWSSKNTAEKIANAIIEADNYADSLIKNISSIKLKYVTSLPTSDISENTIYILKAVDSSSKDTLNLYSATDGWTSIGDFSISLDNYYNKNEVDNLLNNKANSSEIISNDKINQSLDSSTNSTDTVLSTAGLQVEMDKKANKYEVINKSSIATTIDENSTDEEVASAKVIYNGFKNIKNKEHEHNNKIQLDKISENDNGELMYNGRVVNSMYISEETNIYNNNSSPHVTLFFIISGNQMTIFLIQRASNDGVTIDIKYPLPFKSLPTITRIFGTPAGEEKTTKNTLTEWAYDQNYSNGMQNELHFMIQGTI